MGTLGWIMIILLIVGAINWGLIGIANFNLVEWIFGFSSILLKIIYILVGIAGLWKLYKVFTK